MVRYWGFREFFLFSASLNLVAVLYMTAFNLTFLLLGTIAPCFFLIAFQHRGVGSELTLHRFDVDLEYHMLFRHSKEIKEFFKVAKEY